MIVHKTKILIVEDSIVDANLLIDILETNSYDANHVVTSASAFETLRRTSYDLILLDIDLQESVNGYDLCEKIKKDPNLNEIPIIFLTGKDDEKSIETGFKVGGVDYLSKPYKSGELLARIKTHIDLKNKTEGLKVIASELKSLIDEYKIEIDKLNKDVTAKVSKNKLLKRLNYEKEKLIKIAYATKYSPLGVIIFIHGLGGRRKNNRWEMMASAIRNDRSVYASYDIKFQEYPSSYIKWHPFGKSIDINDLAVDLKTLLEVECKKYQEVILIAHSLGGLVARQYIIDTYTTNKEIKVYQLMLYATPNTGSELAKIGILFQFKNYPVFQMRKNSKFLRLLNKKWNEYKLEDKIRIKYVYGGKDWIVRKESAIIKMNNPNSYVEIDKNHSSIGRPLNNQDRSYKILRNFILKL